MNLIDKIKERKARCCVIGLGYVGLPLLVEFAKAGFEAVGIDLDKDKVKSVNSGSSYVQDVSSEELKQLVQKGLITATTFYSALINVDTINICVPTPLRKTREPDISYIVKASEQIARYLKRQQLIILESTTYPGTTEEVLLPMFEAKNLKVGKDFYLAFSPERVDPTNKIYKTKNIPKVVGGVTPKCTQIAKIFYEQSIDTVIAVSSTRVAETVKLLENTFRAVNIGLVNEIALMCNKMNIDVWEVIEAAKTKPFGFMPFYPGPGLGGHCIPIDPFYLSWKARLNGFEARFIELAGQINSAMPEYVVLRVIDALNKKGKSLKGAKVLVMGIAYKRDVNDWRESPALEIIHLLKQKEAEVSYHDPYIPQATLNGTKIRSKKLSVSDLRKSDCVLIATDHSCFDYDWILENSSLVMDTRNVIKRKSSKVVKL